MIGLDTNVLVRYLTQDDPRQAARANRLIENELNERRPGFVGLIVLVEVCWVLKRLYGATQQELRDVVRILLEARQLVLEARAVVMRALAGQGDLADVLIVESARDAGCEGVVSFDRKAIRAGMSLLD